MPDSHFIFYKGLFSILVMFQVNTSSSHVPSSAVPALKVAADATAKIIQELNNKACVFIAMGDFFRANHLLGLALEKHKRAVEDCHHMDVQDFNEIETILDQLSETSTGYHDEEHEYEDDDMDSSNDTFDSHFDCPRDQEQGVTSAHPSAPILDTPATSARGSSKMTACCQIRNVPYAGRQDSRSSLPRQNYQKVYSLPIVMDDTEWKGSSPDDRSFVLVFNSALSNHLWGMNLIALTGAGCNKGPFETAKALYLLALETLWNTGDPAGFDGGRIRSVDKLCVPAIFNNLSHVSKVLHGYASQESYGYDMVLLKSVFWWIDGKSPSYSSSSSFNNTHLRRVSEGDDEVVEAFLDTVFYLIGAPECIAPAAAA
jgi:hypothetical protein